MRTTSTSVKGIYTATKFNTFSDDTALPKFLVDRYNAFQRLQFTPDGSEKDDRVVGGYLTDTKPLVVKNSDGKAVPGPADSWNLGLYVRQVPGQVLTYGILTSAMKALGPFNLSEALHGFTTPGNSNKPFTFEIHEAPYGLMTLIAQGVVTECDPADPSLSCFEPYGYSGPPLPSQSPEDQNPEDQTPEGQTPEDGETFKP